MTIHEIVKDDARVRFRFYRDGSLWYAADNGFEFPVPVADAGGATLLAEDKALLFMRWIRRHLATVQEGLAAT